ncbi:hypothetical protein E2C01_062173 [Portunus trituberculatus]|uniref:Uncharacterized protein n=1 Tax=Portunus trituberculatus TaxID=210409 RepID=A0A5B7HCW9_PORTR|nr:hypothetical protein [Portunus trituberculatus]
MKGREPICLLSGPLGTTIRARSLIGQRDPVAESEFQFLARERQSLVTEDKKWRLRASMAEALVGSAAPVPRQVACGQVAVPSQVTPPYAEFFTSLPQSHTPPAPYAHTYPHHAQQQQQQQQAVRGELSSTSPPLSGGTCLTHLGQVVSQVVSAPPVQVGDYGPPFTGGVAGQAGGGAVSTSGSTTASTTITSRANGVSRQNSMQQQQQTYCEEEELPSCAFAHPHLHGLPFLVHGE